MDTPSISDRAIVLQVLHAVAIGDRSADELPFDQVRAFAAADGIGSLDEEAVIRVLSRRRTC
ncbi:hypothetical protein [Streptomyces sp. MBT62]|uniref:hypothetical protein n=1 Tax=Streptomyces sp. MBT62 TaxID=2800410 RepID=UPI00190BC30E|nr:hypothetical protein [Streptomyces sp. MBT62]MBK3567068.1 hypothetical protein [Streptomyces sp. MBT62]